MPRQRRILSMCGPGTDRNNFPDRQFFPSCRRASRHNCSFLFIWNYQFSVYFFSFVRVEDEKQPVTPGLNRSHAMVCLLLIRYAMGKILIVDDQLSIRQLLSHLFKRVATVISSGSLEDAHKALSDHKFDLVISDLRLSRAGAMEGLALLSHIRATSPDTKVIIISGFGTDAIKEEAHRLGAFDFIEKPINISHLFSRVRDLHKEEVPS
jgi:CheY-like chemotaxis protein